MLDEICSIWIDRQIEYKEELPSIEELRSFYGPYLSSHSSTFGVWVAIANEGNDVLGWQSLLPCRAHPVFRSAWAESSTYVKSFGRSSLRPKGIGKALLAHAMDHAWLSGLSTIIGYIRIDNSAAIELVESLGWELMGRIASGADIENRVCYICPIGGPPNGLTERAAL